jgi:glutamine synthetase
MFGGTRRFTALIVKGEFQVTDLQGFIEADGREAQIVEVEKQIETLGIQYLYCQFVSVTGRIMGKGIPAKHFGVMARKGFQLVYGSTANLFVDRHGDYIGYGAESKELVGVAEIETFMPLPWDPKTARVFCTLFRGREEKVDPGAFLTSDCRGNLQRIHAEFEAKHGLHLRAGCEPEMMWLKTDDNGKPTVEGLTKPNCYHIDQFAELQPLIHKVVEYGEAMGLDMIQGDHEDAPGQLELNFNFDRAELTADRLTTYRQICKQVGREMGAFPCFMPKPFMGVSANGCHHNISLWKGDENKFMPEGDDPQIPGPIGMKAIGGIIAHLDALTCLGSPTVNSYRRLWDTGFWAPVFADWGFQNRTTALRISAPGRFEYRSVDSAVNPYLSMAGLIKAMDHGLDENLDPGPPEERNIYEAMKDGKDVKKIPMNLGEALDALRADEVVKSALPGDMFRVFEHYKRDEWERFMATVTDWDVNEYLDILP